MDGRKASHSPRLLREPAPIAFSTGAYDPAATSDLNCRSSPQQQRYAHNNPIRHDAAASLGSRVSAVRILPLHNPTLSGWGMHATDMCSFRGRRNRGSGAESCCSPGNLALISPSGVASL